MLRAAIVAAVAALSFALWTVLYSRSRLLAYESVEGESKHLRRVLDSTERRPLAPMWHKLGHLIFTHGENFYNFEGLRKYKEKFDPQWQPRYLACPSGWINLPQSLFDASRLIGGGLTGIVHR